MDCTLEAAGKFPYFSNNREMAHKINENLESQTEIFEELYKETRFIATDLTSLIKEFSLPTTISEKFDLLLKEWEELHNSLHKNISVSSLVSEKVIRHSVQYRARSEEKVLRKKSQLSIKLKKSRVKQHRLGKSFTHLRYLWQDSITDMEKLLSTQKMKKSDIEEKIMRIDQEFESELNLASPSPFLERQRKLLSGQEELALSGQFNNLNGNLISVHSSNTSIEFEKVMAELDLQRTPCRESQVNLSIEKSIGGWKSEYESEGESMLQVSPQEIRNAIEVLRKANLLNSQNQNLLGKLSELDKGPTGSQRLELIIQLANLNRNGKKSEEHMQEELEKSLADLALILENSQDLKDFKWEDLLNPDFEKVPIVRNEEKAEIQYSHTMPVKLKVSPQMKKIKISDYQSTGISSQTGLRPRNTLKTAESSQKVFTPGSKIIDIAFKDM